MSDVTNGLSDILAEYQGEKGALIPILQKTQKKSATLVRKQFQG